MNLRGSSDDIISATGNLRNYSDAQLLAELLQNADDAGATRVSFMLDERVHPSSSLGGLGSAVASLQGPALLCYDDAVNDSSEITPRTDEITPWAALNTCTYIIAFKHLSTASTPHATHIQTL
jgi:hypothetical protein